MFYGDTITIDVWIAERHDETLSARRFTCAESTHPAAVNGIAGPWVYDAPAFQAVKGFGHLKPHICNFTRQVLAPVHP